MEYFKSNPQSQKFHEKRDYNHIIPEYCVILVDFTLLLHYDKKENKRMNMNGRGTDQNETPDHE